MDTIEIRKQKIYKIKFFRKALNFFIEFLENLNNHDRKKFLIFITGSPRLPLGGKI